MNKHLRSSELVGKNANICLSIFKFNNTKDLSQITQTSSKFNNLAKHLDNYYKDELSRQLFFDEEYTNKSALPSEEGEILFNKDYISWKKTFKNVIEVKNQWIEINQVNESAKAINTDNSQFYEKFNEEVIQCRDEIYSLLKDANMLPKLRRENHNLESDNNTHLQTHLFDFIYDTQDLFDHYDSYFPEADCFDDNSLEGLVMKNESLIFEDSLKHFAKLFKEFEDDSDKIALKNYRNYMNVYQDNLPEVLEKQTAQEKTVKTSKKFPGYNETIGQNLSGNFSLKKQNSILFLLESIEKSVKSFCQVSLRFIQLYKGDKLAFSNEYSKRFNSFAQSSIQINDYLENLVVIVNYLYDYFFPSFSTQMVPKFSFVRLMIASWNKYVLEPLKEDLIQCGVQMFEDILTESIESDAKKEKEEEAINTSNTSSIFDIIQVKPKKRNSCFSVFTNSDNMSETTAADSHSNRNSLNNFAKFFAQENNREKERKLRALNFSLLDNSSNEFSVLLLNTDKMQYEEIFQTYEDSLVKKLSEILEKYRETVCTKKLLSIVSSLQIFQSSFANTTRHRLYTRLHKVVNEISFSKLTPQFENFCEKRSKGKTNFTQFHFEGKQNEVDEFIEENLVYILKEKNYAFNEDAMGALAKAFISESKNCPNIGAIRDSCNWFKNNREVLEYFNKNVEREVKRKIREQNLLELIQRFSFSYKQKDTEMTFSCSKNAGINIHTSNIDDLHRMDSQLCLVSSGSYA